MEDFDIRDEICKEVGGFKHGQVVRDSSGLVEAVVIGVQLEYIYGILNMNEHL